MRFLVRLVCSDAACAEQGEEAVVSLAELDALACECGCSWELLAVSLDADAVPRREPVGRTAAGDAQN